MTRLMRSSNFWLLDRAFLVVMTLIIAGVSVTAQTTRKAPTTAPEDDPVFLDYKGVKIGWLADDVRKKLGNPANKGDEQDYFVFGEKETAQILYDKASQQVTAISIDFLSGANGVITPQQVFGSDFEAKSDGSKYKIVRYPKAGFWVSYSRTAGDSPIITVTIQKLQQ
jgi:hypothetical protein